MRKIEKKINKLVNCKTEWFFSDYYDTLVYRDCHPEDIKKQWAKRIEERIDYYISAKKILSIRKAAEKKLSGKYNGLISVSYNYEELTNEIFDRLICVNQGIITSFWENKLSFYEESFEIETQIEKEHQHIFVDRVEMLKKIKKEKRCKIAIISDFYMGFDAFEKYASSEIIDLADKIYISCDYAKRKDNGDLYKFILDELNIKPEKVVMIGDNKKSDHFIPKTLGIRSVLVPHNVKCEISKEKQANQLWKLMKKNRKIVYGNYAFSMYFFIDGLYKYLRKNHIEKVLFCAREGEFIKELFEVYQNEKKVFPIENNYFYVSRLASFVPSLKEIEQEKFINLFRQYNDISALSFMKSIGLDEKSAIEICEELQIDESKIINDFCESDTFFKIIGCEKFIYKYNIVVNDCKIGFMNYMDSLLPKDSTICLVDIGWKGTIQDNIFNIYDRKREVLGIYLGLSENLDINFKNKKIGINFSEFPNMTEYFEVFSYDKSFYEKLLCASHASTIGYDKKGNPIFEDELREKETYEYIRPKQLEIIEIFKQIVKIMNEGCWSAQDQVDMFAKIHLYTVCHVNNKHLKLQDQLIKEHFQNFGEMSWSQKNLFSEIKKIFKSDVKGITQKVIRNGLDIMFMYPGTKVLKKMKMSWIIPLYSRLVYVKYMRGLKGDKWKE